MQAVVGWSSGNKAPAHAFLDTTQRLRLLLAEAGYS